MDFFGGVPQYYDRGNDLLNQNRPNPFSDPNMMHPGDARLLWKQAGGAELNAWPGLNGPQQGPRMHNPLIDPRVNSAGLANIHPDVAAAAYGRPNNKFDMLNAPYQEPLPREISPAPREMYRAASGGETPDGSILQEIMRRRRGR